MSQEAGQLTIINQRISIPEPTGKYIHIKKLIKPEIERLESKKMDGINSNKFFWRRNDEYT